MFTTMMEVAALTHPRLMPPLLSSHHTEPPWSLDHLMNERNKRPPHIQKEQASVMRRGGGVDVRYHHHDVE